MEGLRLCEIGPRVQMRAVALTAPEPGKEISIGRSPDCDIQIGLVGRHAMIAHPTSPGEKVSISKTISKVQATLYVDASGRLRIRDGNSHPSASGIRDGFSDKKINNWVLSPGAYVKLTNEGSGYRCWIEWGLALAEGNQLSESSSQQTLSCSQWQVENLSEENDGYLAQIEALESELHKLTAHVNTNDRRHDRELKRLGYGLIFIAIVVAIATGVNIDFNEENFAKILDIAVLVLTAATGLAGWEISKRGN